MLRRPHGWWRHKLHMPPPRYNKFRPPDIPPHQMRAMLLDYATAMARHHGVFGWSVPQLLTAVPHRLGPLRIDELFGSLEQLRMATCQHPDASTRMKLALEHCTGSGGRWEQFK